MKKIALLLLVMFSIPASAEHHRAHALEFIDAAKSSLFWADVFRVAEHGLNIETQHNHIMAGYTNVARTSIEQAEALIAGTEFVPTQRVADCLVSGEHELDCARREISQPRVLAEHEWSAYIRLNVVMSIAREYDSPISKSQQAMLLHVLQNLDFVSWHIQDAIREEIYLDPNFGPHGSQ